MENPIWFWRPGIASTFTPNLGTAQEWITSAEVISSCVSVDIGKTARLSTSSKRNSPSARSGVFFIKESKLIGLRFIYS